MTTSAIRASYVSPHKKHASHEFKLGATVLTLGRVHRGYRGKDDPSQQSCGVDGEPKEDLRRGTCVGRGGHARRA